MKIYIACLSKELQSTWLVCQAPALAIGSREAPNSCWTCSRSEKVGELVRRQGLPFIEPASVTLIFKQFSGTGFYDPLGILPEPSQSISLISMLLQK